jgi:trk system potassium uptake protein TrkH
MAQGEGMKGRFSVALGFLGLIGLGAVLLASPWARVEGVWGSPETALFTACSAVCVTGLSVVDIAAEFSFAGQIALLVLVEIGCLGLMTVSTFLMVAIGRRLSLSREFSLMNAYGVAEVQGVKSLICWVVCSMLVIELAGATVLYVRLRDVYLSIFYSVMGFCNAGFSILPGSIAAFAKDPVVVLVLAVETILGSIGFLVIYNLCTFKFLRRPSGGRGRLSLHTRVVLRFSLYLLAIALIVVLSAEWNATLGGLPLAEKLYTGFYQAVTPRTCGFCIIPTEDLTPLTRHVYTLLMFIGGAPGSAAAGMKVTTLAVLIYTLTAMCRGDSETVIDRKTIPSAIVRESLVIFMALVAFTSLVFGVLLVTEGGQPGFSSDALFFEAVSAITTTGLSVADTTARLSTAGKAVIMAAMFAGRLGALTVVMMIGDRETTRHIRYPQEEIVIG